MAIEYPGRTKMASLARMLALGGDVHKAYGMAVERWGEQSDVATILRAAVQGGSISDPAWAGSLAAYRTIANGFAESLQPVSGFEFAFASPASHKVPFRSRYAVATSGAVANEVGEGAAVPLSALALAAPEIAEFFITALIAVTNDILRSPLGDTVTGAELRKAVAVALDVAYISRLTADSPMPSVNSAGVTAANVAADLAGAAALMDTHERTRLQLLVPPARHTSLALKTDTTGAFAFPDLVIGGIGTLAGGIAVMPCAALTASNAALLVDLSKLAMAADVITLDASREASLEMLDGGSSQSALTGTGASLVSMFQTNSSALRANRIIGIEKLHSDAAVEIAALAW
jgi:hypothetical protein